MTFALSTCDDQSETSIGVPRDPTLGLVLLGMIKYFLLIIHIAKLLKTFSIVRPLLLTAYYITIAVAIAIVTMTFALGALRVSWWHLLCLSQLISHSASVTIVDRTF